MYICRRYCREYDMSYSLLLKSDNFKTIPGVYSFT